jgi:hypothetical protein
MSAAREVLVDGYVVRVSRIIAPLSNKTDFGIGSSFSTYDICLYSLRIDTFTSRGTWRVEYTVQSPGARS